MGYDEDNDNSSEDSGSSFTEETSQSWFSRLQQSIASVGFGLLLFLASFVVLWWNEGNEVKTLKSLKGVKGEVQSVTSDKVDASLNGKWIHTSGKVTVTDPAKDTLFNISDPNAIKVFRNVQMYQWKENKKEEKEKKLGGGERTITEYLYAKEWSSSAINSSNFKKNKERYRNPEMRYKTETFTAGGAKVGAYDLSKGLMTSISSSTPVQVKISEISSTLPPDLKGALYKGAGDGVSELYVGSNPSTPRIGDYKITFSVVKATTVSVYGKLNGSQIASAPFGDRTVGGLSEGTKTADQMIAGQVSSAKTMTWILRLVGFILMFAGISMIFKPLVVVADVIPFLGDILGMGVSFFSGIIAFVLSFITIALAWIFYRPLIGIVLLAIAVGVFFGVKFLRKAKKA